MTSSPRLERIFARIVALRVPILILYALLVPAVGMAGDPHPVGGSHRPAGRPVRPGLRRHPRLPEGLPRGAAGAAAARGRRPLAAPRCWPRPTRGSRRGSRRCPGVTVVLGPRRLPQGAPRLPARTPEGGRRLPRRFATGTDLFRRQGLVGERFLGLAVGLPQRGARRARRDARRHRRRRSRPRRGPRSRQVRKVGAPYVESWIEHESGQASVRYFPLFGLFVVGLALFLYRSVRSLLAILLVARHGGGAGGGGGAAARLLLHGGLGARAAHGDGDDAGHRWSTCTRASSTSPRACRVDEHQLHALANKFLPVTASSVAAVLGFAALAVSRIRPVREMGRLDGGRPGHRLGGRLHPLPGAAEGAAHAHRPDGGHPDRALRPRRRRRSRPSPVASAGRCWSGRWSSRRPGLVALFGVPGRLAPMRVGVDSLDYVDPGPAPSTGTWSSSASTSPGSTWRGSGSGPRRARWSTRRCCAASTASPPRWRRSPRSRRWSARPPSCACAATWPARASSCPQDPEAFARLAGDVEQLLLTEPELRGFVDVGTLANAQLTVVFEGGDGGRLPRRSSRELRQAWDRDAWPATRPSGAPSMQVVGESLLQAKVGAEPGADPHRELRAHRRRSSSSPSSSSSAAPRRG